MSGGAMRRVFLTFACLAICFLFASTASAAIVNPNCAALNGPGNDIKISPNVLTGGSKLHVDATDDVVLNCALDGGSVLIEAHSITVDRTGGNTGGIHTTGTAGIKLYATGNQDKCTDPTPTGATISLLAAVLQDDNDNGGIKFFSCGNILINLGASLTSKAATVHGECLYPTDPALTPWCTMTLDNVTIFGQRIELFSKGDQKHTNVSVVTVSPLDSQTYISYFGSLLAGNNCPNRTLAEIICIPIDQACQFCQECHNHNSYFGGIESNFFAFGEQQVDFTDACIHIAENITITADGRSPVSPYPVVPPALGPGGAFYIDLQNAEIRDDFGKTGVISITALPPMPVGGPPVAPGDVPFLPPSAGHGCSPTWFGTGGIWYDQAVLVDDGKDGGGVDPLAVSFMNGCREYQAGNCAPVALHCDPTPVPNRGNVADPVARATHFVAGVPRCDS